MFFLNHANRPTPWFQCNSSVFFLKTAYIVSIYTYIYIPLYYTSLCRAIPFSIVIPSWLALLLDLSHFFVDYAHVSSGHKAPVASVGPYGAASGIEERRVGSVSATASCWMWLPGFISTDSRDGSFSKQIWTNQKTEYRLTITKTRQKRMRFQQSCRWRRLRRMVYGLLLLCTVAFQWRDRERVKKKYFATPRPQSIHLLNI